MQALRQGNSQGQINGPLIDMPIVRKATERVAASENQRAAVSLQLASSEGVVLRFSTRGNAKIFSQNVKVKCNSLSTILRVN